jgi:hypothetical protein
VLLLLLLLLFLLLRLLLMLLLLLLLLQLIQLIHIRSCEVLGRGERNTSAQVHRCTDLATGQVHSRTVASGEQGREPVVVLLLGSACDTLTANKSFPSPCTALTAGIRQITRYATSLSWPLPRHVCR